MAFLGGLLMKPRTMLTAVHSFLEEEASLIMPLSLPTEEEQAVKQHIPEPKAGSKQPAKQILYDSESDDCKCAGTCSDCEAISTIVRSRETREKLRRQKVEALAFAEEEKLAIARLEESAAEELARLERAKHNQLQLPIPAEIYTKIISYIGDDDLTLIILGQVSRSLRSSIPEIHLEQFRLKFFRYVPVRIRCEGYPNFLRTIQLMPFSYLLSFCLKDICDLVHA